jgi:protein-S-isoprenylcysteine O-methyltransferase Ste14
VAPGDPFHGAKADSLNSTVRLAWFNRGVAWVSLGLSGLFGLLGVGLRSWAHMRRTGRSPIRRGAGMSGWMGLAALALAFVAGPVGELAFDAPRVVDGEWFTGPGLALSVAGIAALLWSQSSMGDSLRIGVDPAERTALVTGGPFRWVRNPIYSAMLVYVAGVALLVPNAGSLVALGVLALGLELHVRLVEEPYLAATHGSSYASYAARVGRFIPGVGKLRRLPRRRTTADTS